MNYKETAEQIVKAVGGQGNINSITHCATRLRLKLNDSGQANRQVVESIDGVISIVEQGGQFQVIIGNEVPNVFREVEALTAIKGEKVEVVEKEDMKVQSRFMDKLIDLVTGIFTPILPALIGAGMIRAILMIATTVFGAGTENGAYIMFNEIYNAIFSFLPVYLAYAAARKFETNPFIAVAVGLTMVSPLIQSTVQSETGMAFLGIPILFPTQGYGSTVIPIIITIWFMSKVEELCSRFIPAVARNILTPLISLAVTIPVMFIVIGPVANYAQEAIGAGYTWVYNLSPLISGIVLGGLWQVLVVFGLHWGIVPLGTLNLAMYGRNTINGITGPSNWSQAGAALGVALKTKNVKLKQTAYSAALTGIFSITEPSIYGVNLKYKKPFYIAVFFAAISGGIAGAANSAALAGGPVGILSFPLFFGEGFVGFVIAMFVSLIGSCVATYLFGYDNSNDE